MHTKSPLDIESDSKNKRFHVKCQKEKLSMAKAVAERKKTDAKIPKKDQEFHTTQVDQSEKIYKDIINYIFLGLKIGI